MKRSLARIIFIVSVLVLLLAACGSDVSEEGPDEVYWGYYQACEDGNYESAELYLDEQAKTQIEAIGICGFTHDAINLYELARGGTERTFSEEPILDFDENGAVMSWVDDQGNLALVQLFKTDDGWKVAYATWSK